MTAFDLLTPGEWKCLAHAERRWLANGRQPVPARDLPGIDLLGEALMLKGYLTRHGERTQEAGVRWELTTGGRERLQEAMDELAAHDALRLLNVPLQPAQERPEGVVAPYASTEEAFRAGVAEGQAHDVTERGEQVLGVDFAVPGYGTIGDRYPRWQDAVDAAQRTIKRHTYQGQKVRTDADDYHPKRHFQADAGLEVYTRAFVHMRVTTPISDSVSRTWEVFYDGSAEALS